MTPKNKQMIKELEEDLNSAKRHKNILASRSIRWEMEGIRKADENARADFLVWLKSLGMSGLHYLDIAAEEVEKKIKELENGT